MSVSSIFSLNPELQLSSAAAVREIYTVEKFRKLHIERFLVVVLANKVSIKGVQRCPVLHTVRSFKDPGGTRPFIGLSPGYDSGALQAAVPGPGNQIVPYRTKGVQRRVFASAKCCSAK